MRERNDIEITHTMETGNELLETFRDLPGNRLPNMIILDQNMPKLNGIATPATVKADDRFRHIPVMIYSTYASDILKEEALQSGAAYVSEKADSKAGYDQMIDSFLSAARMNSAGQN